MSQTCSNRAFTWENQQYAFRTGPTQTELYKHKRWLEAGNFGFRKLLRGTVLSAPLVLHMQIVGFLMRRLIL